jgi:hypothetical protein
MGIYNPDPYSSYALTLPQVCCNIGNCLFFPCLALYKGVYTIPSSILASDQDSDPLLYNLPTIHEEESDCSSSLLNYICVIEEDEPEEDAAHHYHHSLDQQDEDQNNNELLEKIKFTATTLCLSTVCIIPATCLIRHVATTKYHHPHAQEPLWTTGIVSCFAWPCALVQTLDEININTHNQITTFSPPQPHNFFY